MFQDKLVGTLTAKKESKIKWLMYVWRPRQDSRK